MPLVTAAVSLERVVMACFLLACLTALSNNLPYPGYLSAFSTLYDICKCQKSNCAGGGEGTVSAACTSGPAWHGKCYISCYELENDKRLHPCLSVASPDAKARMLLSVVSTLLLEGQRDT